MGGGARLVEGALKIKAPGPGAHTCTLLWSVSFWRCFRCLFELDPTRQAQGNHEIGTRTAKDPEICVYCLRVRHLMHGLTPWAVHLMAGMRQLYTVTHTHTHTRNSRANRQANARELHVHTQTHRDQPVLSCQSEPRPSIKMTVGQTGTRQRAFDFSSEKRVQETFSPHEWGTESAQSGKTARESRPDNQTLPFGALRSSNFLSSRRRPSFPSAVVVHRQENAESARRPAV